MCGHLYTPNTELRAGIVRCDVGILPVVYGVAQNSLVHRI